MILHLLFIFTHTATTDIYTLSLHDALPIYYLKHELADEYEIAYPLICQHEFIATAERQKKESGVTALDIAKRILEDRKSTRLNSSHVSISYAVFCLKKKKEHNNINVKISRI